MEGLKGEDYRARVELTDKVGAVLAAVGDTCERVPASSLEWLVAQALVEPIANSEAA